MLTGGSLRTSLDCSGVLVSAGNNGAVGAIGNGGAGGNSGYMTTIDICANTTYNVSLNTNSSITYGASIFSSGTMNSASGGRAGSNGDDNTFGKGKGGQKSDVPYVSYSGSGYGAGGGGSAVDNTYPSSGGGGGFDPNGYYGLTPPIMIPVSDMTSNGAVGVGKPPVLFLELTKP